MKSYINTLNHPIDLSDGRPVEVAQVVELDIDPDDAHNQGLVDDGTLSVVDSTPQKAPRTPPGEQGDKDKEIKP